MGDGQTIPFVPVVFSNFLEAIPSAQRALRVIETFKDEYFGLFRLAFPRPSSSTIDLRVSADYAISCEESGCDCCAW